MARIALLFSFELNHFNCSYLFLNNFTYFSTATAASLNHQKKKTHRKKQKQKAVPKFRKNLNNENLNESKDELINYHDRFTCMHSQ